MSTIEANLGQTAPPYLGRVRGRPFVKWAGGKRSLVRDIAKLLPQNIGIYWEPFLGGGAVFFAIESRISTARLSDINSQLALTYQVVRSRTEELIERLAAHAEQHEQEEDYYYQVRKLTYSRDAVDVAAQFIYLNKTCFNGLYRVNRRGQFNVPKGSYKKPAICDADGLRKASEALQKATIRFGDFGRIEPGDRDFIYCDPPYDGTFVNYASDGFTADDQKRLRDAALKWHKLGAWVMISNADTPLIRDLYADSPFVLREVSAPRSINCKGDERGDISDLLITTYAT